MAAKPVVDGIEREHSGRLSVIRLNVQEPVGLAIANRLGFRLTPTFIFFDSQGNEAWRTVAAIDPARVRQSLAGQ
ncbi:MAG: thioredoxin family protein [Chloroflexota bacterium]